MHLTRSHSNRAPRRPCAEVRPYLPVRRAYIDVLAEGRRKHLIHGLVEVDVTDARRALRSRADTGQPLSFTAFVMHAVAVGSRARPGTLANPMLPASVAAALALQLAGLYLPFLRDLLHTQPLTLTDLAVVFALSTLGYAAVRLDRLLHPPRVGAGVPGTGASGQP